MSEVASEKRWPEIGRLRFWLDCPFAIHDTRFVYHFGYLPQDRGQWLVNPDPVALGGLIWVPCVEVDALAKLAWKAYEQGTVTLVQYRYALFQYEYIAVRLKRRAVFD